MTVEPFAICNSVRLFNIQLRVSWTDFVEILHIKESDKEGVEKSSYTSSLSHSDTCSIQFRRQYLRSPVDVCLALWRLESHSPSLHAHGVYRGIERNIENDCDSQ